MTLRNLVLASLLAAAAAGDPGPPGGFVDATKRTGIDFRHTFGGRDRMAKILEATGPGVALLDYDGDGDQDLYFVNGGWVAGLSRDEAARTASSRLYRNDGGWKFADVTGSAGVGHRGYGIGCAAADYDGDGHVDLYLCNYGPNVLYRNRGDGTFADVTADAGVAGPETLNGRVKWSTNALFLDADGDADLDLYVCNYLAFDPAFNEYYGPEAFPGPSSYLGQPSLLFRNEGGGRFTEVTKEAGLWKPEGRGMGASALDFDGDGDTDIFEANDSMANYLWRNLGGGKFEEIALDALVAYGQGGENTAAMHGSVADYDGDGRPDILVADANFNALHRNLGEGRFRDDAQVSGLAKASGHFTSWGGFLFDYDDDGTLDIFLANGGAHHLFGQQNSVLRGRPGGRFEDVSLSLGKQLFFAKRTARGAAFGDLDEDGDLDIVVQNIDGDGSPTICENRVASGNHWIGFRLRGLPPNTLAVGARVTVETGAGRAVAWVHPSASYLSSCDPRPHFGLGAMERATKVEVRWPRGGVTLLENLPADRYHTIVERSQP